MAKVPQQCAEAQETESITPVATAGAAEPDRAARLLQLRAAIEAGTYEITGSDLVDKLTKDLAFKARR